MKLISMEGLNCYDSCLASVAYGLGIDYPRAFSTLWSETDFVFDQRFTLYLSKRMPENLERLGMKVEKSFPTAPEQAEEWLHSVENGAFVIVGMDACNLPWSPIYQFSHDGHYFFLQKDDTERFFCFDPSYGVADGELSRREIISWAFELDRVRQVPALPFRAGIREEAARISQEHPGMHACILADIEEEDHLISLGKYMDAFISNRYLYRHFLSTQPGTAELAQLFHDDYFMEWKAVKNGLFKASLLTKKGKILGEVKEILNTLIQRELEMARQAAGLPQGSLTGDTTY